MLSPPVYLAVLVDHPPTPFCGCSCLGCALSSTPAALVVLVVIMVVVACGAEEGPVRQGCAVFVHWKRRFAVASVLWGHCNTTRRCCCSGRRAASTRRLCAAFLRYAFVCAFLSCASCSFPSSVDLFSSAACRFGWLFCFLRVPCVYS